MAVNKVPSQSGQRAYPEWPSETFLNGVLGVVPGLIYVFNQATMSNEYVNRSIGEAMGYSEAEVQSLGANLMPTICHPDDLDGVMAHFQRIGDLADGEVADIEYRVRHRDGHWVWLLSHDTVFDRNAEGEVVRHIGMASDITRQKVAEETALSRSRLAAVASEDLRAFVYALSHELKAPSNTIAMILTEVLTEHGDEIPEDVTYLLGLAADSVRRAQDRIEDVLSLARFLGREPSRTPVSLNTIVAEAISELGADTAGRVTVGPLPDLTACAEQIRTLFKNLIENGLTFCRPEAPSTVEILDESDLDDSHVTIVVRDTGIGIPPHAQDRIFEMFKRLHPPSAFPGNGLGLAICRRIVHGHSGSITVTSEPGQGSEFRVRLMR